MVTIKVILFALPSCHPSLDFLIIPSIYLTNWNDYSQYHNYLYTNSDTTPNNLDNYK